MHRQPRTAPTPAPSAVPDSARLATCVSNLRRGAIALRRPRRLWVRPRDGLACFSPWRDLVPLIQLLRQEFGAEMDEDDRRWLSDLEAVADCRPLLAVAGLAPLGWIGFHGFVWLAEGRLVGNVTLMRRSTHSWLLANVVTDPQWRRLGIGRRLVTAAMDWARERGIARLELEVRTDNEPAQALYQSLGFERAYAVARLSCPHSRRLGRLCAEATAEGVLVRSWLPADRSAVQGALAAAGIHDQADTAGPLAAAFRRHPAWPDAGVSLAGRRTVGLVAVADGRVHAVLVAEIASSGGSHRLEMACHPAWRGKLEAPLLTAALAKVATAPDGRLEVRLRTEEEPASDWLLAQGLTRTRTMDRLAIRL